MGVDVGVSAHEVVLCVLSYRRKPLLTRGPDSCVPVLFHSGCGCCLLLCLPTKWFCVLFHIGETLINTGPLQLCSSSVTQWFWVLCVVLSVHEVVLLSHSGCGCWVYAVVQSTNEVVLCDLPYMGNPY